MSVGNVGHPGKGLLQRRGEARPVGELQKGSNSETKSQEVEDVAGRKQANELLDVLEREDTVREGFVARNAMLKK